VQQTGPIYLKKPDTLNSEPRTGPMTGPLAQGPWLFGVRPVDSPRRFARDGQGPRVCICGWVRLGLRER
jgi:hypothetical protein